MSPETGTVAELIMLRVFRDNSPCQKTLQQGTIHCILDTLRKYTQIFYTYRHILWTNILRHVNSSSATDAQRWWSRLKGLGTFPFRDYKDLGKKQTVIVHLLEERQIAWEILDSLGCYEIVQVYGTTMLTIIFASWF